MYDIGTAYPINSAVLEEGESLGQYYWNDSVNGIDYVREAQPLVTIEDVIINGVNCGISSIEAPSPSNAQFVITYRNAGYMQLKNNVALKVSVIYPETDTKQYYYFYCK